MVGAGESPSVSGAGGAAVNGSATLINGGPGVHNVPNGAAAGTGLQNNLGAQASLRTLEYHKYQLLWYGYYYFTSAKSRVDLVTDPDPHLNFISMTVCWERKQRVGEVEDTRVTLARP